MKACRKPYVSQLLRMSSAFQLAALYVIIDIINIYLMINSNQNNACADTNFENKLVI